MKIFTQKKRLKKDILQINILAWIVVGIFALMCFIPFYVVIINSFASESSIMKNGYSLIPSEFTTTAYQMAFNSSQQLFNAYKNTIVVTLIGTFSAVILATMTGYVLARPDFQWRNRFSLFFFITTLFNGGLTASYLINTQWYGFKNTLYALILPCCFSVWNMVVAKTFIKGLPYELTESAKIDGANDVYIFFRIILPVAKPCVATLCLFSALTYWNDWYNCMLYENKESLYTLQYYLQQLLGSIQALKQIATNGGSISISGTTLPQESMKMAMTVIATGPIILLYPFIQRYFVKGLTIGSVKG